LHLVEHREFRHRILLDGHGQRPTPRREDDDHVDGQGHEFIELDDAVLVFVRLVDEHPHLVVRHTQVHLMQ